MDFNLASIFAEHGSGSQQLTHLSYFPEVFSSLQRDGKYAQQYLGHFHTPIRSLTMFKVTSEFIWFNTSYIYICEN